LPTEDGNTIGFSIAANASAKATAMRIRYALSSVSSDPMSAGHQTRNPPPSCVPRCLGSWLRPLPKGYGAKEKTVPKFEIPPLSVVP
jgi:hypothetical protein